MTDVATDGLAIEIESDGTCWTVRCCGRERQFVIVDTLDRFTRDHPWFLWSDLFASDGEISEWGDGAKAFFEFILDEMGLMLVGEGDRIAVKKVSR